MSEQAKRQKLLWDDELLRKPDLEVDNGFQLYLKNNERVAEDIAAKEITGDENVRHALSQLKEIIDFLRQPPGELTDEELEFRNGLMAEYRLASFLRIYEDGVWYAPACVFLRDDVFPKWRSSSIKKSRARKRGTAGKRDAEKKFKKNLVSVTGRKPPTQGKRDKGQRKKTPDHGKKNSDQGKS